MDTEKSQDLGSGDEKSSDSSPSATPKKNATKKAAKKAASKKSGKKAPSKRGKPAANSSSNYPRHTIEKALRIPRAILEQNAGRECSKNDAAKFIGLARSQGPFEVEVSSALKYGLLERPNPNQLKPSELAKKILRPQASDDELNGYRQAVLNAPIVSEVYKHYRGEYLPDTKFFSNALTETFKVPAEKLGEFIEIFIDNIETAKLSEKSGDKTKILDIANEGTSSITVDTSSEFKKLTKSAGVVASDTCFVMMPFAAPLGEYYLKIYEPATLALRLN